MRSAFGQEKPRSVTFYSIIFSGIKNGQPVFNTTKLTLNGTDAQIRQQISSVADRAYDKALELTKGPAIFLGPTPEKTSVLPHPTKADLTRFIESVVNRTKTGNVTADAECWLWLLGGGSMHGSCPKEM